MVERLIKLLKSSSQYVNECDGLVERIADHLLENGVIVPPCKVGDTVWFIRNGKITETKAEKIVLKYKGVYIKLACNSMYETSCNSIGKTVFFSREEAERSEKDVYV